jgi:hypothetical protein
MVLKTHPWWKGGTRRSSEHKHKLRSPIVSSSFKFLLITAHRHLTQGDTFNYIFTSPPAAPCPHSCYLMNDNRPIIINDNIFYTNGDSDNNGDYMSVKINGYGCTLRYNLCNRVHSVPYARMIPVLDHEIPHGKRRKCDQFCHSRNTFIMNQP